jgi:hypothetical protein
MAGGPSARGPDPRVDPAIRALPARTGSGNKGVDARHKARLRAARGADP